MNLFLKITGRKQKFWVEIIIGVRIVCCSLDKKRSLIETALNIHLLYINDDLVLKFVLTSELWIHFKTQLWTWLLRENIHKTTNKTKNITFCMFHRVCFKSQLCEMCHITQISECKRGVSKWEARKLKHHMEKIRGLYKNDRLKIEWQASSFCVLFIETRYIIVKSNVNQMRSYFEVIA